MSLSECILFFLIGVTWKSNTATEEDVGLKSEAMFRVSTSLRYVEFLFSVSVHGHSKTSYGRIC
jgi:hypothetical protein